MLKQLRAECKDIIAAVERDTGLRVRLAPSERHYPARTVLSDYLANPTSDEITISYNPRWRSPDYAIGHEAARFLRFWRAPPGERCVLGSMPVTARTAYARMEQELGDIYPNLRQRIAKVFPILYDGLLTQLFSTPVDFWINKSLCEEYPGLHAEINAGLSEIFQNAHQVLQQPIRAITPRTIYRVSNAMNAAFASFAGELLGRADFARPYRGSELEEIGRTLRTHNATDRGHAGDKETTDRWAEELGVRDWYEWMVV